jgi:hypothetical protein
VLVHLSVDEDEIRIQVADVPGKAIDRHRDPGSLAPVMQSQESVKYACAGISRQELLIPARFQWKEVEAVILDERSGLGMTGEGQSMAGNAQAPGELDARVDDAGQTAGNNENASHCRYTVLDSRCIQSAG